jgi:pSer/pThr/pTyr-binding forkhead associated (FHA) protein
MLVANVFLVHYPESPVRIPEKGKVSIGRADTNTIILTEPRVSRLHALIEWQKDMDMFVIADLGSKNGTHLNGYKIAPNDPHPIGDWNKIRITSTVFTVRFVDDPSIIKNEFKELRERMHQNVTEVISIAEIQAHKEQQPPGISGDLEHLCPVELFQMLESGKKTGMLSLKTDRGEGTYSFEHGNVVSAAFANLAAEKAVYEVLTFNAGTFAFTPQEEIREPHQINLSTTMLLMEGCRMMDEANAAR